MSREEAKNINWNEVIKKEARGKNDEDLGEVQEVGDTYILVQKGLINKEKFYIPQNEVESYNGDILRFRLSEEDIKSKYLQDSPTLLSSAHSTNGIEENQAKQEESESSHVPLIEENLNISKREVTYKEATLIKEPVTETKTVEVSVTHEELIVERRPPTEATTSQDELKSPVTTKEEINKHLFKRRLNSKGEALDAAEPNLSDV